MFFLYRLTLHFIASLIFTVYIHNLFDSLSGFHYLCLCEILDRNWIEILSWRQNKMDSNPPSICYTSNIIQKHQDVLKIKWFYIPGFRVPNTVIKAAAEDFFFLPLTHSLMCSSTGRVKCKNRCGGHTQNLLKQLLTTFQLLVKVAHDEENTKHYSPIQPQERMCALQTPRKDVYLSKAWDTAGHCRVRGCTMCVAHSTQLTGKRHKWAGRRERQGCSDRRLQQAATEGA